MGGHKRAIGDYEDFVNAQTIKHPGERREVNDPPTKDVVSTKDKKSLPKLQVGYYTMAEWMQDQGIELKGLTNAQFKNFLSLYRVQRNDYQDQVVAVIDTIKKFKTGRALFDEFSAAGHSTVIIPHSFDDLDPKRIPNPATEPLKFPGGIVDATAKGGPIRPGSKILGTGLGADAEIKFSPDEFPGVLKGAPGTNELDWILFHELFHSLRIMQGTLEVKSVNHGYNNQEEYLAIVISNIYKAEKKRAFAFIPNHGLPFQKGTQWVYTDPDGALTKDRKNHVPLPLLTGADAENFLSNPQHVDEPPMKLMDAFKTSQAHLYCAFAHLPDDAPPVKYNWVKQHFQQTNGQCQSDTDTAPQKVEKTPAQIKKSAEKQ